MKVKILDPRGLRVFDKTIPEGETVELESGPILDAALRFKQAESVEKPKKADKADTEK